MHGDFLGVGRGCASFKKKIIKMTVRPQISCPEAKKSSKEVNIHILRAQNKICLRLLYLLCNLKNESIIRAAADATSCQSLAV